MKKPNILFASLISVLAVGMLEFPTFADAATRPGGGGGHAGARAGGGGHGGGGGRRMGGGYRGGRGNWGGGGWSGGGGWGGGYYNYCGPIQLTLGLCGPFGL